MYQKPHQIHEAGASMKAARTDTSQSVHATTIDYERAILEHRAKSAKSCRMFSLA